MLCDLSLAGPEHDEGSDARIYSLDGREFTELAVLERSLPAADPADYSNLIFGPTAVHPVPCGAELLLEWLQEAEQN